VARFQSIVQYWPSNSAVYLWDTPDLSRISTDFHYSAELGIAHLQLSLVWHDFQPDHTRVAVPPLRALESTLERAAEVGLVIRVVLFPTRFRRFLLLPDWALHSGTNGMQPVLSGHHVSRRLPRNPVLDGRMVEAEQLFIREVVGAFGDHPSISSWVLGDRIISDDSALTDTALSDWLGALAGSARQSGAHGDLWHAVGARDLVLSHALDPLACREAGVRVEVAADWRPSWAGDSRIEWAGFLAAYAKALGGDAPMISNIGPCTSSESTPIAGCLAPADAAIEIDRTLASVREMGGAGTVAAAMYDFAPVLQRSPPLRDDAPAFSRGLLRADGGQKATCEPWIAYSQARLETTSVALDSVRPDPELRRRDPEGTAREAYEAYVR
jgi:hypothetical protein